MKFEAAVDFVGDDYGPSPGMITNIVFRFILNLGAALACLIPMRLFYRNRELAGTAMVIATAMLNFYYGVDSIIWPNNNIETWFKGYGWCDTQLVLWIPLETINSAAICAVMQNIANQVSLMRASGLTSHEKRRKHLVQALIIFPVPALQIILYYFSIGMRYNISGIIGCQAVFQTNWVFLVLFVLPCPIFAVAAAYFAGKSGVFVSFHHKSLIRPHQLSLGGGTGRSMQLSERNCMSLAITARRAGVLGREGSFTSWP